MLALKKIVILQETRPVKTGFQIDLKTVGLVWIYPPASKESRDVAILTEKKIFTPTYIVSVCLSLTLTSITSGLVE